MFVGVEAKSADPFLRCFRANSLQHADRNHVLRLGQTGAQGHGAVVLAVVVLRFPGLTAGRAGIKEQRSIVDHRGGGEAFLQGG